MTLALRQREHADTGLLTRKRGGWSVIFFLLLRFGAVGLQLSRGVSASISERQCLAMFSHCCVGYSTVNTSFSLTALCRVQKHKAKEHCKFNGGEDTYELMQFRECSCCVPIYHTVRSITQSTCVCTLHIVCGALRRQSLHWATIRYLDLAVFHTHSPVIE